MRVVRGYTLLELLVVMGLIALATGLVAPAGYRMLERWRRATESDDLLAEIARLPAGARATGTPLTVVAGRHQGQFAGIPLPSGWEVELDVDLRILANGVCLGSRGALVADGARQAFALDAPLCRSRRIDTP